MVPACSEICPFRISLLLERAIIGRYSASPSRLAHGGLRYLETGEVPFVRNLPRSVI